MKVGLIILSLIILLISYVGYNIIIIFDPFTKVEEVLPSSNTKCEKINYKFPIEDFLKIGENTYIGSSADYRTIFQDYSYLGGGPVSQGSIVEIDTSKKEIRSVPIKNFPKDVSFHPHGIEIFQDKLLYIINHSLNEKDGERVEIVKLTKDPLSLQYVKSIKLPEYFFGKLDALTVLDYEVFYFSTWKVTNPPTVNNHSDKKMFSDKVWGKLNAFLNLQLTGLYLYSHGNITFVPKSKSLMGNGLTYDSKKRLLYFAQTAEMTVQVYKIDDSFNAEYVRTIKIGLDIDNISFNEDTGILSVAVLGPVLKYQEYIGQVRKRLEPNVTGLFGGLVEVDTYHDFQVKTFHLFKDTLFAVSSALRDKDKTLFSSSADNGFLVCDI